MRYNSPYSDWARAAYEAHTKELLRLALNGQKVKKTNTQIPPIEAHEAENCVTDAFIRLLSSIEKRNPKVMEIVLDHNPNSNVVRYLMILFLQRSIIDMLRKRNKGTYVSEANMDWMNRIDPEMNDDKVGALEWLLNQVEPDWHETTSGADTHAARADLIGLFNQALAAGKLNEKYQRAFQVMMDGFLFDLDDDAIAKNLKLETQDYQKLKYKIIQKLRLFAGF